ncbi:nucleoside hydrolase [Kushneria phosphatilytica]|uniref:Nucleoside hydrolase n=1 Tax=Kushneria phosphatilytica TaxID=657387 RepID=A0A1S1NX55_9GAMM|nr:nucleoside hydrolase [Kushneria phosphatilytica]OHV11956.1 nucleoside hydrolase [Kushneria phosphatilytica]QEL11139.1 nucleoside hydrolase [Kushneria phosphatilytica]
MSYSIIFDTDPGVDDAQAIALLMADPDIEIVGLTTTFGNVPVEVATRNALLLTELAGRDDIPVAQGAAAPLVKQPHPVPAHIHGKDGLGNQTLAEPRRSPLDEDAARFIINKTQERPGEITLVCVGPLGNLANALQLDPDLPERVARVIVMGGSIHEGGNVTPVAEANIFSDPHAASRVLKAPWPLTMVGLDVTHRTVLAPDRMERICRAQGRLGEVLAASYAFYRQFYGQARGIEGCCPHDSCALAWLKQPELFESVSGHLHVVTEGIAEGQTLLARKERQYVDQRWQNESQAEVCLQVDGESVVAWMESLLTRQ